MAAYIRNRNQVMKLILGFFSFVLIALSTHRFLVEHYYYNDGFEFLPHLITVVFFYVYILVKLRCGLKFVGKIYASVVNKVVLWFFPEKRRNLWRAIFMGFILFIARDMSLVLFYFTAAKGRIHRLLLIIFSFATEKDKYERVKIFLMMVVSYFFTNTEEQKFLVLSIIPACTLILRQFWSLRRSPILPIKVQNLYKKILSFHRHAVLKYMQYTLDRKALRCTIDSKIYEWGVYLEEYKNELENPQIEETELVTRDNNFDASPV